MNRAERISLASEEIAELNTLIGQAYDEGGDCDEIKFDVEGANVALVEASNTHGLDADFKTALLNFARRLNEIIEGKHLTTIFVEIEVSISTYETKDIGTTDRSVSLWHFDEKEGEVRGFMALGDVASIEVVEDAIVNNSEIEIAAKKAHPNNEPNADIEAENLFHLAVCEQVKNGTAQQIPIPNGEFLIMHGPVIHRQGESTRIGPRTTIQFRTK